MKREFKVYPLDSHFIYLGVSIVAAYVALIYITLGEVFSLNLLQLIILIAFQTWAACLNPARIFLDGETVLFGTRLKLKASAPGAKAVYDSHKQRLVIEDLAGRRLKIGGFGQPIPLSTDLTAFLHALSDAGAEVTGHPLPRLSLNPADFVCSTKLTSSLNWSWPEAPGEARSGEGESRKSQEVRFTDSSLTISRGGMEVLRASLHVCQGIKISKADEVRLLIDAEEQGVWPLADWNAQELTAIEAALIERGVKVADEPWPVPVREVISKW